MADPITIMAVGGMAATAGGGIMKAMGDQFTGKAQAAQANYQAAIADMNAKLAQQDANYAIASGGVEAQEKGLQFGQMVARTKAGFAAGNIDAGRGTASDVVTSELAVGQQSQAILRANAAKRAYGFQVTAAEDTAQGGLYRMAAKEDIEASKFNIASSILGAAGQVSSQYVAGRTSGVFSG